VPSPLNNTDFVPGAAFKTSVFSYSIIVYGTAGVSGLLMLRSFVAIELLMALGMAISKPGFVDWAHTLPIQNAVIKKNNIIDGDILM